MSIVARGEDALRLYKRLSCAARGLGVELAIEERRGSGDPPRVLVDGALLLQGLPRAEVIQQRLAAWLAASSGAAPFAYRTPPGAAAASDLG